MGHLEKHIVENEKFAAEQLVKDQPKVIKVDVHGMTDAEIEILMQSCVSELKKRKG